MYNNNKNSGKCLYKIEYNTIHLLPTGCKICFQDFLKIAPAGKNFVKLNLLSQVLCKSES